MPTAERWRNPGPASDLDEVRQRGRSKDSIGGWLRSWWPALLWAAVIFVLSTGSFSSQQTGRFIGPILRWLFPSASAERLVFMLIYRGVRHSRPDWRWNSALGAWLIAAAYSGLDEFHQVFVASRGPSVWDALLDSAGALVALLTLFFLRRLFERAGAS